jgi:hypothetical protein
MYDISKGQLWVMIVCGGLLWLMSLAATGSYDTELIGVVGIILIPALIVFYILGWKRFQNEKTGESKLVSPEAKEKIEAANSKITKLTRKIVIPVMILILGGSALAWFIEEQSYTSEVTSSVEKSPRVISNEEMKKLGIIAPIEHLIPRSGTTTESLIFSEQKFVDLGKTVSNDFTYKSWDPKQTDGKFMKVEFTVENTEKLTQKFDLEFLGLIDDEMRQFPADKVFNCHLEVGEYTVSDQLSYNEFELKPGIPCKFRALIEVAEDVDSGVVGIRYKLR